MTSYIFSNIEYQPLSFIGFDRGYDNNIRFFADVNGDGKADFCREVGTRHSNGSWGYISCLLAEHNGFTSIEYKHDSYIDVGYDTRIRQFVDVNGDGKADFCRMVGSDTTGNPIRPRCLLADKDFISNGLNFSKLTNSLVAYYPFTGDAKDFTIYSNDGVIHKTTLTTGHEGGCNSAYQFNGVDSYIKVADGSLFNFNNSNLTRFFSVSSWWV